MGRIWTPDSAALDLRAERAALLRAQVDRYRETFRHFNQKLKEIDPNLELVRASEDATAPGLKPGYWCVVRHVPGGQPLVIVHQGPNGEYREPDSGLFEELRRGDMWNDRARKDREKAERKARQAREREEEREVADRVDEMTERLRSLKGTQIRVKGNYFDKQAA